MTHQDGRRVRESAVVGANTAAVAANTAAIAANAVAIAANATSFLCPTEEKSANYTAAVGELVVVDASAPLTITAPPNPSDCDEWGVWSSPDVSFGLATIALAGNGKEFLPMERPIIFHITGTMRFKFDAEFDSWLIVQEPTSQTKENVTVRFDGRDQSLDASTFLAVAWSTVADNHFIEIEYLITGKDEVSGDMVRFMGTAILRRDGSSVVTLRDLGSISPFTEGTIATASFSITIAAQTINLNVIGVVARTIRWHARATIADTADSFS